MESGHKRYLGGKIPWTCGGLEPHVLGCCPEGTDTKTVGEGVDKTW